MAMEREIAHHGVGHVEAWHHAGHGFPINLPAPAETAYQAHMNRAISLGPGIKPVQASHGLASRLRHDQQGGIHRPGVAGSGRGEIACQWNGCRPESHYRDRLP